MSAGRRSGSGAGDGAPGDGSPGSGPALSRTARKALAGILVRAEAPPQVSMRLVAGGDGFELLPDTVNPDDVAFEHDGRTILLVAPDVRDRLQGFVVDAEEDDAGMRLTIARAG